MKMWFVRCAALVACALPASFALAVVNVNGVTVVPRVFNDFTTSTLNITNNYPASVVIDDRNMTDDGIGGNFANRHDVLLSADGGATAHTFNIDDSFTVKAIFQIDAGAVSPRKEAGIRINSNITGDALFIINTNGGDSGGGEIVAFGGGAQFYSFSGGPQADYTAGTPILLGETYRGALGFPNRTIQYFIDRDPSTPGGIEFSPEFPWSDLENGPVDYTVGFYGQVSPANANDFMTLTITNPMFANVPEPSSVVLAALSALGLAGFARRRS